MKSLYAELRLWRVLATKSLSRIWPSVHFSCISPLRYGDVEEPTLPGPQWVKVRPILSGICGTDLHIVFLEADVKVAPAALPGYARVFLGHEVVGRVAEAGTQVEGIAPGERVVLRSALNCHSKGIEPPCRHCEEGNHELCENQSEGMLNQDLGGGWSEAFVAHQGQLLKVPDELSDEEAVLLEPMAVAMRAVLRRPPLPGDKVIVVGAGTIGLGVLQVARMVQPEAQLLVLARHEFQAERARRLGAERVLTSGDAYEEVAEWTGAKLYKGHLGNRMLIGGADLIYDCVGSAHTLTDSLRWTRAGGAVVLVGVNLKWGKIDWSPVWLQEVDLIGTVGYGAVTWQGEQRSAFRLTADLATDGKLHLKGLVTHRFPLAQYRKAIETVADKRSSHCLKGAFHFPSSEVP